MGWCRCRSSRVAQLWSCDRGSSKAAGPALRNAGVRRCAQVCAGVRRCAQVPELAALLDLQVPADGHEHAAAQSVWDRSLEATQLVTASAG